MAMRLAERVENPRLDLLRNRLHLVHHHPQQETATEKDERLAALLREGVRERFTRVLDSHGRKEQTIRVRYLEAGEEGMPKLIAIHGSGTSNSVRSWHATIPDLSRHFHMILPDIPGFGKTDKNLGASTVDYYAKDFLPRFVEAVGFGRFKLMGTSMGGAIATSFALDNPSMIDRDLINISGYGFNEGSVDYVRYLATRSTTVMSIAVGTVQALEDRGFFRDHEKRLDQMVKWVIRHINNDLTEEQLGQKVDGLKNYLHERLSRAEWQLIKSEIVWPGMPRTDHTKRMHEFVNAGIHVLLLHGLEDWLVPPEGAKKAGESDMPGVFFFPIEGVEHGPQTGASKEVNKALISFMQGDRSFLEVARA